MSRISVLLPYRDAAVTLAEAMQTVLADLGGGDELVAIDDGSSDGSAAIARAIAGAQDGARARVVLVESGGTASYAAGMVGALTRGLDAARGELVGRMDADDISLAGRFAAERELLESDATIAAVGVMVEAFPAPTPGMERYVAWQGSVVSRADHARAIFIESPLCHPSTLIRGDALRAVGGYREVAWAEDYDLWLRLDAAGYGLAKVPSVLFRWRMRPASVWRTDPHCTPARFVEARAHYLAIRLRARGGGFAIWGAGKTGRRLARALEAHELRPTAFLDIDPRKIGREARGIAIVDAADGMSRATRDALLLIVAVGTAGARDVVRARLSAAGLVEGQSFLCAA